MLQLTKALLFFAVLPILGACSNLKPVATFGAGATALGASYRPFVTSMVDVCKKTRTWETITHTGDYNYSELSKKSELQCKELADKKETAFQFATVVEGYGAALVELAGMTPDALSADIGTLADTASSLKTKGGDAIFNANALSAANKLASGIVEIVLGGKITKVTKKTLSDAHEPLATTVDAMKIYVTRIHSQSLAEYGNDMAIVEAEVIKYSKIEVGDAAAVIASKNKAITYRLHQAKLNEDRMEISVQEEKAEKFSSACDSLIKAHKELIDKFDEKTAVDKMELLQDFIKKARALRDAINKA